MGKLAQALTQRYKRAATRQLVQTIAAMKREGDAIEQRMKATHPWTNRTWNAEKSLGAETAAPRRMASMASLVMRVGYIHVPVSGAPQNSDPYVKYGKFLELAHGGRWAIVRPTVRRYGPQVGQRARAARRLSGGIL